GPHQLPECAHLFGTLFAKKSAGDILLCFKGEWLSLVGPFGNDRSRHGPVPAFRQKVKDIPRQGGPREILSGNHGPRQERNGRDGETHPKGIWPERFSKKRRYPP